MNANMMDRGVKFKVEEEEVKVKIEVAEYTNEFRMKTEKDEETEMEMKEDVPTSVPKKRRRKSKAHKRGQKKRNRPAAVRAKQRSANLAARTQEQIDTCAILRENPNDEEALGRFQNNPAVPQYRNMRPEPLVGVISCARDNQDGRMLNVDAVLELSVPIPHDTIKTEPKELFILN